MRKTEPPAHDHCRHDGLFAVQSSAVLLGTQLGYLAGYRKCWHWRTFPYILCFAPYVLKSLVFRRFGMKKGLPDFSENPQGGVRGIRTLEPLNTTNTLAGCPYRPLRHVSMLHIGATTWHLTIVPRTSATRCAARGVIRGLTTGQRAGFESPVNVTITATISSATPAISRRPALRQARPRAGGKEIATAAPQPVRQGPLHPGPARYDKGYEYRT